MTYKDLYNDVRLWDIPDYISYREWVAVAKGGFPLALMLGHKYGKKIHIIDPHNAEVPNLHPNDKILLIEDIISSGKTFNICKSLLTGKDVKTLCYLYDPTSDYKPDYYLVETSKVIEFPWETKWELEEITMRKYGDI
jgi:hypoxanthine phosphoribosyltransferase